MPEIVIVKAPRLAYPSLFAPSHIGPTDGERPKFRVSAIMPSADMDALPEWLRPYAKEAKWRGAPAGHSIINFSTLFRVPVFGLEEDFLKGCELTNQEPDRVLALFGPPGEIMVSLSHVSGRDFVNLIAVRVTATPRLRVPDFSGFPALLGAM